MCAVCCRGVRHLRRQRLSGRQGPPLPAAAPARAAPEAAEGAPPKRGQPGSLTTQQMERIQENRRLALQRRALNVQAAAASADSVAPGAPAAPAAEALAPAELARASPEASEAQALPAETPQCVICRADMLLEESRLALPCGHVLHSACIQRHAECTHIALLSMRACSGARCSHSRRRQGPDRRKRVPRQMFGKEPRGRMVSVS